MRAALITTGSVLLTTAVIGNAFYHKKQFYPSVVYITKSNPSMAVIYIQCLVMFLLVGKLMRKIFFGTLRAAELEHLIERAWYAVTETCLAFTVYRDDLNARFVGIFAVLLFLKCFHWLAEDRVDFMERSPNINILFHVRIVSLLTVLASCDLAFMYTAYLSIVTKGAGTQLVFGFEYAILLATILNIVMKYILHWVDIASDSPWDEKAVCLLYTELVMSILKVTLYLTFVAAMLKYHNFPLFALRPIYLSLRTLKKALCDVIMSRRAIRNMNTLYPNATQEELANTDNVCIICREEMTGNGTAKKLPCNHIFHVSCLRSWFQRQQTCPTCRMDILRLPSANSSGSNQNIAQQQQQQQQQQAVTNNRVMNNQQVPQPGASGAMGGGQVNATSAHSSSGLPTTTGVPNQAQAGSATTVLSGSSAEGGSSGSGNGVYLNASQTIGAGGQHQPGVAQAAIVVPNEVTSVMIQMFAQMFVQAMLAHLRTLNEQQQQQRQTLDASTQTTTLSAEPPDQSQASTSSGTQQMPPLSSSSSQTPNEPPTSSSTMSSSSSQRQTPTQSPSRQSDTPTN